MQNSTVSGLNWQWTTSGGVISNPSQKSPDIYFPNPGTYTVTLTANNNKATQVITKNIVVRPNSNLRTFSNIKFGINTAHVTLGSFYSTKLRKTFKKNENLDTSGKWIDLVFFGINSGFSFNKFISPDSAAAYTFDNIPQAQYVKFINSQELCSCGLNFTSTDFDNMVNDVPLIGLNIYNVAGGWQSFTNALVPRIVLFQTVGGRKGAIKVKQFVQNGADSYILVDIKIQKN